jgi:phospholipase/carboxylesterase
MAVGELPTDSQLEKAKPKVIYCRGSEDQRITKEAIATLNTLLQSKTRATTKTYAGLGHSVDERVMRDVSQYITSQLS